MTIELFLCKFAGHGAWILSFDKKDTEIDIELIGLLDRKNVFNVIMFLIKIVNIIVCLSYLIITYSKYQNFRNFLQKILY